MAPGARRPDPKRGALTVSLALRTDVRVGGAGRKKTCCRSGCAGCPWTRALDGKLTEGLDVVISLPPSKPPSSAPPPVSAEE